MSNEIKIPGNYQEARAFWAEYIKRGHPDDSPIDIPNLGPAWFPAWDKAGLFCHPWALNWSENFDLLPDFKIGDRVKCWEGVGSITHIRHSHTGQPIKAKIILDSGNISKLMNCSSLEVVE